jgi:hypothetical protein
VDEEDEHYSIFIILKQIEAGKSEFIKQDKPLAYRGH